MSLDELYEDDELGLPFKNFRFVLLNKAEVTRHMF